MRYKYELRRRILEEKLLSRMDDIKMSDRNKEIVRKHVAGASQTELGKEYGLTVSRITAIVANYISKCYMKQIHK